MTSQLWNHLSQPNATDAQAVHLYLTERDERGNLRHASLYDLGDYGEERLLKHLDRFIASGDEAAMRDGWALVVAAFKRAADATIERTRKNARRLPALTPAQESNWLLRDDGHEQDYREERLAESATAIEAGRDFVEELAVRA